MVRKTAGSLSAAVKQFLEEGGDQHDLSCLSVNIVSEKVFTDKYEYTVEISGRGRANAQGPRRVISDDEISAAAEILHNLLDLSGFRRFTINKKDENGFITFEVEAGEKDGLLIGKDGRNINSLQYIFSLAMEKKLGRPATFIIDVDNYREKRASRLRATARELGRAALENKKEILTELLPSYERKIIHEAACHEAAGIKTFSVGRGQYKKVVITAMI